MKHYNSINKLFLPIFILSISVVYPLSLFAQPITPRLSAFNVIDPSYQNLFEPVAQKEYAAVAALPKYVESKPVPKQTIITTVSRTQGAVGGIVALPKQLIIPKIGVNTSVEHLGLTPQGAIAAPAGAKTVSWFTGGAIPGNNGSAIISGHHGIWKNGSHSVFDNLQNLTIGDTIYVKDKNNVTRSFVVKAMRVYSKDAQVPELFNRSDKAYLDIITCYGTYIPSLKTYDRRLIVFAELKT